VGEVAAAKLQHEGGEFLGCDAGHPAEIDAELEAGEAIERFFGMELVGVCE
jgi:hypothetical protein